MAADVSVGGDGDVAAEPSARPAAAKGRWKPARWVPKLSFALACLPLAWVLVRLVLGRLGANPIAEVLNRLGWWTLALLMACLACTPLQIAFKWKWPLLVRRQLGLFAFFYGCLHLVTYAVVDQGLDLGEIGRDIVKRRFITVGMATLLLLVPLAVTSTAKWMKRLGFARWKRLHRLVYVAAALGVVHFLWRVKADYREPMIFAAVLGVLLGVRLVDHFRRSVSFKSGTERSMVEP